MNQQEEYTMIDIQKKKNATSRVLIILIAVFFSAAFFLFGYVIGERKEGGYMPLDLSSIENKGGNEQVDFALFWDVWEIVKEKYVDNDMLKAQDMVYGAINGMLAATGDPYTVFLDPEQFAELNEELSGSFEGIGAEVGIKDEIVTIVTPLDGSPAQKAGLRAGDKIIEIEGESTGGMLIDAAVKRMRGQKGTELHLKIFRISDEKNETLDLTIVRDTIHIESVRVSFVEGDIAHIKILQFGDETIKEFNRVIGEVMARKSRGVIVDVRNDPGGILNTAIVVASKFLPERAVVVIEEDAKDQRKNLYTSGAHPFLDIPVVVLINEGSASASEILAGALRDNREDVVLIGKKSFGKGSVQELIPTSSTTAAKITVAKWLTPSGEQINEKGIEPDETVEYSDEDYKADRDPQLDRAIQIMKEKIGAQK